MNWDWAADVRKPSVKLPPWSYSFLSTADNCPHQALHKFVLRDIEKVETKAQADGIAVHEALARRITKKTPLSDPYAHLEGLIRPFEQHGLDMQAELKLGVKLDRSPCDFFDKNVWGRGVIDVVAQKGENALIIDWKNGKQREDPFELKIQACLLKAKYPELKLIEGFYFWLKSMDIGPRYNLSDTDAHWQAITARVMDLVRCLQLDNWPKVQSPLCGWCDYTPCEHNRRK